MKTTTLTAKQQELLDAMKSGVRVIYMRYMGRFNPNPYYFRTDTHAKVTVAARGLLKLGLAVKVKQEFGGDHEIAPKPEAQP